MTPLHRNPPTACRAARTLAAALMLAAADAASAQCSFVTTPAGIVFSPALDPSAAVLRQAFTEVRMSCSPPPTVPTWSFTGLHGAAPLRLKHGALAEFIPYTAAATNLGGPPSNRRWRITATILGADYENASVGSYSDTLTASILP
jgi:hypothetical protein